MINGFAPIQYSYMNFWQVLINNSPYNPKFTTLVRLTEATLLCEPELEMATMGKLKWLWQNVDEHILTSLPAVELLYYHQMRIGAGLNKELEINGKAYKIIDIYEKLDSVNRQLVEMMMQIAKKYSLEIPLLPQQSSTQLNIGQS